MLFESAKKFLKYGYNVFYSLKTFTAPIFKTLVTSWELCVGNRFNEFLKICLVVDSSTTLTKGFPSFFLSSKANARVTLAKTGHGPHASKLVVICVVLSLFVLLYCYCVVLLLFVLFCYYLCCYIYCLCVNVYCTTATGCLPNCSWQMYIISY